jgi:hypothetical protein
MAKPELIWPGERMRAFFRAVLAAESALDAATRERLIEALSRPINRMLVWHNPADQPAAWSAPSAPLAEIAPQPDVPLAPSSTEARFDPYAFSAVAVFTKGGRDALMERLAAIGSGQELRALALAQHLAIANEAAELEELREAIVKGTEQRIADRRAAAS